MVEHSSKRKKHHDKDKYYKLAKEQGFRSRAAFKLIQINRKYHFLENANVVLDLCAAPGGWTQVASRTMNSVRTRNPDQPPPVIIAVDILPIRHIGGNVTTLIGDITTDKTKTLIKQQLQSAAADVVLCDGAPDVGASYDRDAYMQNEIALHALKCATQHLTKHGTFVTKIYRSSDYNAFLWVMKHFFQQVQVVKPSASRTQSAEIFLIGLDYLHPTSIDPQMFDPKCVFEQVDGAATGGGDHSQAQPASDTNIHIFHKKYDEKRRSRQGYDLDKLDFSMRNIGTVTEFIQADGSGYTLMGVRKDPIQMLSSCTGLSFNCSLCSTTSKHHSEDNNLPCHCKFYLEHKSTTAEIKTCLMDLKVLNKSDFKALLTWRNLMQEALKQHLHETLDVDGDDNGSNICTSDEQKNADSDNDSEDEEKIQADIAMLRQKKIRQQKKLRRKEREILAKRRKRTSLTMDSLEIPENEKIFSLASITSKGQLERVREVDLSKVLDEEIFGSDHEEDYDTTQKQSTFHDTVVQESDDDRSYSYRLDRELDEAYDRYLITTKNRDAKKGTQMAKRSKKAMRQKLTIESHEDSELAATDPQFMDEDTKAYAKLLKGDDDYSDDSGESKEGHFSDDDGFQASPVTPEQHKNNQRSKIQQSKFSASDSKNPLIFTLTEESSTNKSARWFSNPVFEKISSAAALATITPHKTKEIKLDDFGSEDSDEEHDITNSPVREKKRKIKHTSDEEINTGDLTADQIIAMMPKTDKQMRHEKRIKSIERQERRAAKRSNVLNEQGDAGFEIVGSNGTLGSEGCNPVQNFDDEKEKEVRALIKAGFGKEYGRSDEVKDEFEVVPSNRLLPICDERRYDSENENYDSDDYATTLALGTMMLRKSKAKALVDASYNRYAWNDPDGLPDWFVDDEKRHYRPQLPIPPELLAKMKQKFLNLAAKPIAKVAEARARKQKRIKTKIAAAKKKAAAVASSTDMTETMKLKAISKAMRGQESSASKKYVVSRKNGLVKGGKGVKLVDKRMKRDKRAMDRITKGNKRRGSKRK